MTAGTGIPGLGGYWQPVDLEAVRALCDAATTGSWAVDAVDGRSVRDSAGEFVVASVAARKEWPSRADAAFIAAARTLVPQMAAEVAELRDQLADEDRAGEVR